jgi:hypothetical protein
LSLAAVTSEPSIRRLIITCEPPALGKSSKI